MRLVSVAASVPFNNKGSLCFSIKAPEGTYSITQCSFGETGSELLLQMSRCLISYRKYLWCEVLTFVYEMRRVLSA